MYRKFNPGLVINANFKFWVANGSADRDDFKWTGGHKTSRRERKNETVPPHVYQPLHRPQFSFDKHLHLHFHRFSQETEQLL